MKKPQPVKKAKERPAEVTAGIGGLIAAVGALFGWDPVVVARIGVTAAFLPALVTYFVSLKRAAE